MNVSGVCHGGRRCFDHGSIRDLNGTTVDRDHARIRVDRRGIDDEATSSDKDRSVSIASAVDARFRDTDHAQCVGRLKIDVRGGFERARENLSGRCDACDIDSAARRRKMAVCYGDTVRHWAGTDCCQIKPMVSADQ